MEREKAAPAESDTLDVLEHERHRLLDRLHEDRARLAELEALTEVVEARVCEAERLLDDIESALGRSPQLRLDESNIRLRGQRLSQVAIEVLESEYGAGAEIHYRDWFNLLRARGHSVAGRRPLSLFLSQINRTEAIERVGRRSGLYRLAA